MTSRIVDTSALDTAPPSRTRSTAGASLGHHLRGGERRRRPGAIGTRRGDGASKPEGKVLTDDGGWPTHANTVALAQQHRRDGRVGQEEKGQRARPKRGDELSGLVRQVSDYRLQLRQRPNDHRQSFGLRAPFHRVQTRNGVWPHGIDGQSIHRISRIGHDPALSQDGNGLRQDCGIGTVGLHSA